MDFKSPEPMRICLSFHEEFPVYSSPVSERKAEQRALVEQYVQGEDLIPYNRVAKEVHWFYTCLGVDDTYFLNVAPTVISSHIIALYGAKLVASTKQEPGRLIVDLEQVNKDGAIFIHSSQPGLTATDGPGAICERRIDESFLDKSTPECAFRLKSFRPVAVDSDSGSYQLRCYFVTKCNFPSFPSPGSGMKSDIRDVADRDFLESATDDILEVYNRIMSNVESHHGPVIEVLDIKDSREKLIVIGYKTGGTSSFFSALSKLYHFHSMYSTRKYVEQFSNGVSIISLFLNQLPIAGVDAMAISQVRKEVSLLFCLPNNPYFVSGTHSVREATYAYCGSIFAQHFCNRLGTAYLQLRNVLDEKSHPHTEVLNNIKRRLWDEIFTQESIEKVIHTYPELIRLLYIDFALVHYPKSHTNLCKSESYQHLQDFEEWTRKALLNKIRNDVREEHMQLVLESLLIFNESVLKTNFYQPTKLALSFRLNPNFLPDFVYPKKPFGMFLVIGNDFRGFHVRFHDVARGGIRLVTSRNKEDYSINRRSLFDENYALAATQNLKNKDILEGGAKGIILPSIGAQPRHCFEKYMDAMLDLLITNPNSIKEPLVDLYGKEEMIFFGPDEGTADMMDWAAEHACDRGADWWRSFTTGKSPALGGIPHDRYGMTSRSIRQYVLGIYEKFGLVEEDVTKVQIGGPDGDLGSNEILLSHDKTIAVVDKSGVLYDPEGINRDELCRLAKSRLAVENFKISALGEGGYLVKVDDLDITLPSGELVPDGLVFRNRAHLRFKADLFVPCGGRPDSVSELNVEALIDPDGKPHFKYIVEGANLFFTQKARLFLEERGVIVFKDSSANKGGVTSSSLEVLAALALEEDEYDNLMAVKDGSSSEFYDSYVRDVQAKIEENAKAEFHCIWDEHERLRKTSAPKARAEISDELSIELNSFQAELEPSIVFDNLERRAAVMNRAIPQTLIREKGLDAVLARLKEPYQRALFASYVSSRFIYKSGINASKVKFFEFASDLSWLQE